MTSTILQPLAPESFLSSIGPFTNSVRDCFLRSAGLDFRRILGGRE